MKPFFSIIVCTFNREQLLPRALDSVVSQSFEDWEVVVVDDGSTGGTAELLAAYESQCNKLSVVRHKQNCGVGVARNTGVKHSSGRYITFLDSDDEYLAGHLANRKRVLQQHPDTQLLHGGLEVVGDPFVVDKDDYGKRIHVAECAVGGTFFIRRDVFNMVGLFNNLPYADDSDFFERAMEAGITIQRTSAPTYRYFRNTQNQITASVGNETVGRSLNRLLRELWARVGWGLRSPGANV